MRYVDGLDTRTRYSVIGLGTWQFGSREWGYGEEYATSEALKIVRRARELGITLFDTAEMYGFGHSERILGEALAGTDVGDLAIATKIFPVLPVAPVVEQRAVASARRLGVQRIDLYQVHQPNPVVRDGTTMRGMRALQEVGLVDEVGVSNYSLARWNAAQTALGARVLSNQVHLSLLTRQAADQLVPFAAETGRLVIAYSPLEQGVLSGRYDAGHLPGGVRQFNPSFFPENLERLGALLGVLRDIADAHGATPAQIALAWVVHHPHVAAIPGASSVAQLESNAAAAEIELRPDEFAALTAAAQAYEPPRALSARRMRRYAQLAENLIRKR